MKTVRDACQLQENALSIKLGDQIEQLQIRKADLSIGRGGMLATAGPEAAPITLDEKDIELPDILTDLQDKTQLTRRSLARILNDSQRLPDFTRNVCAI